MFNKNKVLNGPYLSATAPIVKRPRVLLSAAYVPTDVKNTSSWKWFSPMFLQTPAMYIPAEGWNNMIPSIRRVMKEDNKQKKTIQNTFEKNVNGEKSHDY
jgi:hypothetical protein